MFNILNTLKYFVRNKNTFENTSAMTDFAFETFQFRND